MRSPPRVQHVPREAESARFYDSWLIAVPLAFTAVVTADIAAYVYGGWPWGICALLAGVIALTAWALTTLRRPRRTPSAFSLYIAAVTAMMLLEAEEWYGRMPSQLMTLYPDAAPPSAGITEHAFIAVFPLALSALFVLGALTYYHGSLFGQFCAWLAFAWGLVASLSVYAYALMAHQPFHYLGGMSTAPILCLVSLAGMLRLARMEHTVGA